MAYQATIPTTIPAPIKIVTDIKSIVVSTIIGSTIYTNTLQTSTLTCSTIQINALSVTTLIGSTIQANTSYIANTATSTTQTNVASFDTLYGSTIQTTVLQYSTIIGNTIQTNAQQVDIVSGSSIQTNIIVISSMIGNSIQTNTLYASSLINSSIQTSILYVSSVVGSTIQTNTLRISTLASDTTQLNGLYISTLSGSTIIGNTFQINTCNVSTSIGSIIQTNQIQANMLACSTIQTNLFMVDTINISGTNIIKMNTLNVSTVIGSSIIGRTIQSANFGYVDKLIASTIQSNLLSFNTLTCSTIQNNTLQVSSIIGSTLLYSTVQADTVSVSSLMASSIQTNTLLGSTIVSGAIQTTLYNTSTIVGSTIVMNRLNTWMSLASTIQTSQLGVSTMIRDSIQMNTLLGNSVISDTFGTQCNNIITTTLIGSTIQSNIATGGTFYVNTLSGNTMTGSTIQAPQVNVSTLVGSTIIGSTFQTNKILTTDGNKALSTSAINASQLPYLTNVTSQAGGTGQTNTWTTTQTFSVPPIVNGLTTSLPPYALGINASKQMVQYTYNIKPSLIGTLSVNYVPYASGVSTLSNSIIYRVNATDVAMGQITSYFPTGTGTIFSIAGILQTSRLRTGTGSFSKIVMADKRSGLNGTVMPGSQGCNFFMGTMNNDGTGNLSDALYLNSKPNVVALTAATTNTITDALSIACNVILDGTQINSDLKSAPSLLATASGLTISILLIYTGSTMPAQGVAIYVASTWFYLGWYRYHIGFNSNGTIYCEYGASDQSVTTMNSNTKLVLNTLYHIVWTVDPSGNHILYINGKADSTMTKYLSFDNYYFSYFGTNTYAAVNSRVYPIMTIVDFRRWERPISSVEVTSLYYSLKITNNTQIISGQYIVLNRPTNGWFNLSEIRVYSSPDGPNIITPTTTVTMSNPAVGGPLSNVVDGNLDTFMYNDGNAAGPLTIDLGSSQPIYKIVIYNRRDCCLQRANGTILTIQNSSRTTIYTANPIADKLGRTTYTETTAEGNNKTDYFYTFTYFPTLATVIGDNNEVTNTDVLANIVMFDKNEIGMRIFQGTPGSSSNFTTYKNVVMTDENSLNLTVGKNSDTDGMIFGPNTTWGGYLKMGAGTNRAGLDSAQCITTDGNLYLDCAKNTKGLYLNYYVRDVTTDYIFSYTPWTHNNNLSISQSTMTATAGAGGAGSINVADWYKITNDAGMYWSTAPTYLRGFVSPEKAGNSYGNASTWGTPRNSWSGWGLGSKAVWMTYGNEFGIHDNNYSWTVYCTGGSNKLCVIAGSCEFSQNAERFRCFVNGSSTAGGYFYVKSDGTYNMSSDERIKKNITPINQNQSIAFINGIIPSHFSLKKDKYIKQVDTDGNEIGQININYEQSGFIAQNVLESAKNAGLPESTVANTHNYEQELLLPEEQRKTLLGINITPIISHSINVLKALIDNVENQQFQIEDLQRQLETSEADLNNLQQIAQQQNQLLQQILTIQ